MTSLKKPIMWLLRLVAVIIMVQSLFFKFSGAEESIYIFSTLGMEPWGRIGTGIVELISSVILLIPSISWLGAGLGMGTMAGALFFHLTTLGIVVKDDGGQLFIYAIVTFACCAILLLLEKEKALNLVQSILQRKAQ